ncbi:hypothetical protein DVH24_005127 [Malus domestica]|uniref:Uncharacterized protein n=1 Tax=Malus domestica TaxID=3750 RepID=A0A498IIZ3_MALDO|nr:hypothetical protein DVH24_005127 [Malus domestica]
MCRAERFGISVQLTEEDNRNSRAERFALDLPKPPTKWKLLPKQKVEQKYLQDPPFFYAVKNATRRMAYFIIWLSLKIYLERGQNAKTNLRIPVTNVLYLSTVKDNQDTINFRIYEGESSIPENSYFLGECSRRNIPPAREIFNCDGNTNGTHCIYSTICRMTRGVPLRIPVTLKNLSSSTH